MPSNTPRGWAYPLPDDPVTNLPSTYQQTLAALERDIPYRGDAGLLQPDAGGSVYVHHNMPEAPSLVLAWTDESSGRQYLRWEPNRTGPNNIAFTVHDIATGDIQTQNQIHLYWMAWL